MKKARFLYLGICLALIFGTFSNFRVFAEGEEEPETEAEVLEVEGAEEEIEDKIFINSLNPGFSEIGEFFEIGGKFKGDFYSLAGLSVIYTAPSSGNDYIVYEFLETEEMVGESLLFRLKNSPEVKEVGEENYQEIADTIYSRGGSGVSKEGGRLRISRNYNKETKEEDEVLDSFCWEKMPEEFRLDDGEYCYPKFEEGKTYVRNDEAEEIEDLFVQVEDYLPSYDPEKPGLFRREVPEEIVEPKCQNVAFNEILTYFETSNTEQFIELHNRGDNLVDLEGCSIKYKNKFYELFGAMQAGELKIFTPIVDFKIALTKNPTSSNTLEIIDVDGSSVDKLTYYSGQKKGVSLAQFGYDAEGEEQWLQTYSPTPGEENNYQKFKTCQVGKVINPETGNCVNETTLDKTLEACPEGKYRNPLTNRCKSYATTTSAELKPCAEGYERNPATGRCRKIVSNSGAEYPVVEGEFKEESKFVALYAVIGVLGAGVIYIIYQFRDRLRRRG